MTVLCSLAELKRAKTLGINAAGTNYIVVWHDQQVKAYINSCPHLAIPLEWQEHQFMDEEGEFIRCSTHGALFLPLSGQCISGPCAGDAIQNVAVSVQNDYVSLSF